MGRQNLDNVNDLAELNPNDINLISEKYGEILADRNKGIKTNQVRNVYSSILSIRTKLKNNKGAIDESIESELILLKPKLAYASGRQKNVKPLYSLFKKGIDGVISSSNKVKALDNFINLVEGIVAYHKYFGGKEN